MHKGAKQFSNFELHPNQFHHASKYPETAFKTMLILQQDGIRKNSR